MNKTNIMENIDLNALRDRAYKIACDHGFHDKDLSNNHFLMLTITELSEALEADRKEKWVCKDDRYNYIFSQRPGFRKIMYDKYIKGNVEEELADAVIRLLDLAGLRKVDMSSRFIISYVVNKKKSFAENCYAIIKDLVNYKYSLEEQLNYAIRQIFELASFYDIDLAWHIEQKMQYNELRPRMHGKKY